MTDHESRTTPARGVMIAGAASGIGKTTITVGLLGALRRRGYRVQPFKAGPDYIDPSYHAEAAGVPARNLDSWLLLPETLQEVFARAANRSDIAVVEGVMGLFDGRSATADEGSGAQVAKMLGLPVILVVDASGVARSVAATVLGFQRFDPGVNLAGVILNRIGSDRHLEICREAIKKYVGLPVLGALPRSAHLQLPERHLGLIPEIESRDGRAYLNAATELAERYFDLDAILKAAEVKPRPLPESDVFPSAPVLERRARIAVARDRAFNFYYQDSLDLLEAWGAEIVAFSPLEDAELPGTVDGVFIGGGFPELFATELSANSRMRESIRRAAREGRPIYAECGGLMYLGAALIDGEGTAHRMVGLLPAVSAVTETKLTLGYRTVRARRDGPLMREGQTVRGHEFHLSRLEREPDADCAAYEIVDSAGRLEGYQTGNVVASYVHVNFASDPALARRFVDTCARTRVVSSD